MTKFKNNYTDKIFLKSHFEEFFRANFYLFSRTEIKKNFFRISLTLDKLWVFDPILTKKLLKNPSFLFPFMEKVLNHLYDKNKIIGKFSNLKIKINLEGPFGNRVCFPRKLRASFLGEIICIKGMIIKCTDLKVKLESSVHFCSFTKKFFVKKFQNNSNDLSYYNLYDKQGNSLDIEYGLSEFKNWQGVLLQDLSENLGENNKLKTLVVILENDLINTCNLGDKVELCGIYKPFFTSKIHFNLNFFYPALFTISVKNLNENLDKKVSRFDSVLIKNFSSLANSFEKLSSLIAPEIFNQKIIKKGLLLFLVGGSKKKKILSFVKDEINVLLIGDASGAKTQFLQFITKLSPSSFFVVGKSVETKKSNFEIVKKKILKTEQIIQSHKGILCIDNLEKISEEDKIVLKEMMEQQSISIQKNGFDISLKIRCSILSAANPKNRFYDFSKSIEENLGFTSSILSRFDLIFTLFEDFSIENDDKIANHILSYYEKSDSWFLSRKRERKNFLYPKNYFFEKKKNESKKKKKYFNSDQISFYFLKIYIQYAKKQIEPILSNESIDSILNYYEKLRNNFFKNKNSNLKQLESLIKLISAFAKCHLRSVILEKDVINIFDFLRKKFLAEKKLSTKIIPNFEFKFFPKNLMDFSRISKPKTKKEKIWNEKIIQSFFYEKEFETLISFTFNFFKIKKLFFGKKKVCSFERTLSNWIEKEICFIFNKTIILV